MLRLPANPRDFMITRLVVLCLVAAGLASCGEDAAQRAAAESAARNESAATALLARLEAAVAEDRPDLARAFAEDLLKKYPQSAAAQSLQPRIAALREAGSARSEARRLSELWTYHDVADPESDGRVRTAFIYAIPAYEGAPAVRLVIRRHASWGQSVYLLINDSDFTCAGKCSATLSVDGGEAKEIAISRAVDNVPPAVFIDDDAGFLATLQSAKTLALRVKLLPARETTLRFEVAGFQMERIGPAVRGSVPGR